MVYIYRPVKRSGCMKDTYVGLQLDAVVGVWGVGPGSSISRSGMTSEMQAQVGTFEPC